MFWGDCAAAGSTTADIDTASTIASARRAGANLRAFILKLRVAMLMRRSEVQLEIHVEDVAVAAYRVGHFRVTHVAIVEIDPLAVHPQAAHSLREIIDAEAPLRSIAVVAANLGEAGVELQQPRHQHRRGLDLIAVVVDVGDAAGACPDEIAELAPIVLG